MRYHRTGSRDLKFETSKHFARDVEWMGRYHIYGSQNKLNPVGLQTSLNTEQRLYLRPNEESFGLGYEVELSLRKGRRVGSGELLKTPMGMEPFEHGGFAMRPEKNWYPQPFDIMFEVIWNCRDEEVPHRGKIDSVITAFRVDHVMPMYGSKDDLVYWKLRCSDFAFIREDLVRVLKSRWKVEPIPRKYQRQ